MGKTKINFKVDKYKKTRGGRSRLLSISCAICGSFIFLYQKDGPGTLKRVYLDRILGIFNAASKKTLTCSKCQGVLGTYYLYLKEQRPAFRLYQDAVVKKNQKLAG